MKEKRNMHLKVQEMCDCYATSDPLAEMEQMKAAEGDVEELAVKWLALAVLHGINSGAEEIKISMDEAGGVRVKAEHPNSELPAPDACIADAVMDAVREITHIEADKGRLPLSIGIRGSSVDLLVKVKSGIGRDKVSLVFKSHDHHHHKDRDAHHHHEAHHAHNGGDHHGHHHGHHHDHHHESHHHQL